MIKRLAPVDLITSSADRQLPVCAAFNLESMMRRIRCAEIWGGVHNCDEDILTSGITASLYSAAADGGRGGDIYYLSVCSSDLLTRIAIADVVGHGEVVAITSQWMYHALAERMNCIDGDGILNHLNHLSDEYGIDALTTAVVIGYSTDNSQLYFAYAGHPPLFVRHQRTGRWGPLNFASPSCTGNLPFGVEVETRYDQERVPLPAGIGSSSIRMVSSRPQIVTDDSLDSIPCSPPLRRPATAAQPRLSQPCWSAS